MPTMTAVALERLFDSGRRGASSSPPPLDPDESSRVSSTNPYYISPALFAASDRTSSIPDSSPFSPYVFNRKRRDLPTAASGGVASDPADDVAEAGAGRGKEVDRGSGAEVDGDLERAADDTCDMEEDDPFFDPRDNLSVASSSDAEDGGGSVRRFRRSWTPLSTQSEFYDAADDFFSDGSSSLSSPSIRKNDERELWSLRLNLSEETEKRKRAEETLLQMQNQWQRMVKSFFQVGLTVPDIQNMKFETDLEALCQEIVVTKFVSDAVERGIARAETEAVLEEVIESKNREISRLRDRLQYYEAMNREMSQRNQKVVELARQQRLKRKTRKRWIWSSIAVSATLGTTLLAYSYWSHPGKSTSASAADSGEGDACQSK